MKTGIAAIIALTIGASQVHEEKLTQYVSEGILTKQTAEGQAPPATPDIFDVAYDDKCILPKVYKLAEPEYQGTEGDDDPSKPKSSEHTHGSSRGFHSFPNL